MHAAMAEMVVVIVVSIMLMVIRMTEAVHFMTMLVTIARNCANGICPSFETGKDDAD